MQVFRLHKEWLCQQPKYLYNTFNGKFLEGETQVMNMEEVEPEVFGLFVQWIVSSHIQSEFTVHSESFFGPRHKLTQLFASTQKPYSTTPFPLPLVHRTYLCSSDSGS